MCFRILPWAAWAAGALVLLCVGARPAAAQFAPCANPNEFPNACLVTVLRSIFTNEPLSTITAPTSVKKGKEFTLTVNPATDNFLARWTGLQGKSAECATSSSAAGCKTISLTPTKSCKRYDRSCTYKSSGGVKGKPYLVVFTNDFGSRCGAPCGEDPYYIANSDDFAWSTFTITPGDGEEPKNVDAIVSEIRCSPSDSLRFSTCNPFGIPGAVVSATRGGKRVARRITDSDGRATMVFQKGGRYTFSARAGSIKLRPSRQSLNLVVGDNGPVKFFEQQPRSVTILLEDVGFSPALSNLAGGGSIRVCNQSSREIRLDIDPILAQGESVNGENVLIFEEGKCRSFRTPRSPATNADAWQQFSFRVSSDSGIVTDNRRSDIFAIGDDFNP